MSVRHLLLSVVLPLLAAVLVLGAAAPAQAGDDGGALQHCAVKQPGGAVWCWGSNFYGQVSASLPNYDDNPGEPVAKMATGTPVVVPGVSGARSVAVGDRATCALLLSGGVKCWGQGPLGDGNSEHSAIPVAVAGLSDASAISMGTRHACALRSGGQVVCWGVNNHGQLGDGSTDDALGPVTVSGVSDATAIAAGRDDSCAVVSGGTLRCWGRDDNNNLGDGGSSDALTPVTPPGLTDAADVAVQGNVVCAIQVDGDVFCAGAYFGAGAQLPVGGPVRQITWGGQVGCLVFTSGRISCAGADNSYGQMGDGTLISPDPQGTLVDVVGIDDATSVTVGAVTACATHASGDVSCWGFGAYGGVGTGRVALAGAPNPVAGVTGATQIAAGNEHVCSLGPGRLSCWGSNGGGRIDAGAADSYWSPVTPSGHAGALALDADGNATCVVESDHSVSCWGGASSLASGGSALTDATAVTVSSGTACAVRSGGTVSCWGDNWAGQLGNGDTASSATPVDVSGVSDAVQVTSGTGFNCALRAAGAVVCWGYGGSGRLGGGDNNSSSVPTTVTDLNDAVSISAGTNHVCAARSNGTVRCWGENLDGQLGDGTTSESNVPVTVATITDADSVSAGEVNSCAIRAGGALACWGKGVEGQLAFDTQPTSSSTPVAIPGITDAVAVAAGYATLCAVRQSGAVSCWGSNDKGQLGDGFMPDGHGPQATPHKVIGFGWDGPSNGGGGGGDDTPPSAPGPAADPNPLTPPTLTPPAVTPPVLLPPAVIEALLAGKRITINANLKLRKGQRCTGTVTATTAFGTTTYRVSLKLKAKGTVCSATGTIKLKKTPSLRTKLRITISGKPIKARSLTTQRS